MPTYSVYDEDAEYDEDLSYDGEIAYLSQENAAAYSGAMPQDMVARRFSSSVFASHEYVDGHMHVVFKNGQRYRYKVSQRQYDDFVRSSSPGEHFHRWIRPHGHT